MKKLKTRFKVSAIPYVFGLTLVAFPATANADLLGFVKDALIYPIAGPASLLPSARQEVVNTVASARDGIYQTARSVASVAGPAGTFVFDVATFQQNHVDAALRSLLLANDPLELTTAPLAGAIHAAHDRYISQAKPLPPDVKAGLAKYFPQAILDRARWTVGSINITLPDAIGQTNKLFGKDFAVTVDDLIVFNNEPGSFKADSQFWAHEVTHVAQYTEWGVEGFAKKYVYSLGHDAEDPAYDMQGRIAVEAPPRLSDLFSAQWQFLPTGWNRFISDNITVQTQPWATLVIRQPGSPRVALIVNDERREYADYPSFKAMFPTLEPMQIAENVAFDQLKVGKTIVIP